MSFELKNGASFRLMDQANHDVTLSPKANPDNVKLEIDVDGDGKFNGEKDLTITDKAQLSVLLDKTKGNAEASIPFAGEIEEHLINKGTVANLLDKGKEAGMKSNSYSIFQLDDKLKYGKDAFKSVQNAYNLDKANPDAKLAYSMALYKINDSSFKGTAAKKLEINLDDLTGKLKNELSANKMDVHGQMGLKYLCDLTNDPRKAEAEKNLVNLKKLFPEQYAVAEKQVKEALAS
jgi:hypothetical protein